jgi:hypothetical protein
MNPYAAPTTEVTRSNEGQDSVALLGQTRPWVLAMSIMMFLGSAFMLLASALVLMTTLALDSKMSPALSLVYLPFGVLYIYPAVKLLSYASAISRVMRSGAASDFEAALRHQKSFWKYCAIATLVLIASYFVFVIGLAFFTVAKR